MTYSEIAAHYANDVLSGKIPACKQVKEACQRQQDDLESPPEGFFFDLTKAERICKFAELMPHIKGQWAGKPITLEPWQVFILTTVFGWVDADGNRRFKTAYIEVPRKNAKSTLSSAVALYCLAADGEGGAEVYSAATTRDQARIVFQDAKRMAEKAPGLQSRFGVKTSAHAVYVEDTASTMKALSRDQGGNLDGLNVHCGIIDELHAHKTRDVFDVIETATGARTQPLLWLITTAGFNRTGICYEQRAYVSKILNGSVNDPEYFGIIYTIDEDDDWATPEAWAKANPNWGVSVNPQDIERKARKAIEMASAQNNFLTKHLNCWVNADTAWMDMRAWDACADPTLDIADFEGLPCFGGLDLASKIDIASRIWLFERDDKLYVFDRHYLPEETIENAANSQYQGWEIEGHLMATPGNVIDLDEIERDILDDVSRYQINELGYDPFQATQLSSHLAAEGVPVVEVRPTVLNFSEPMKELEALVLSGKLKHNGSPVLTWMVSNVVCHLDKKDNIYPNKEFPENKIDGVVALIMALNRWMAASDDGGAFEDFLSDPIIL